MRKLFVAAVLLPLPALAQDRTVWQPPPIICNHAFAQQPLRIKAACIYPNDPAKQAEWIAQMEIARQRGGLAIRER